MFRVYNELNKSNQTETQTTQERKVFTMKALLVAHTVITSKQQAKDLVKRLNRHFEEDRSVAMANVIDDYTEQLVNAGFLTWEEAEEVAF